jgi:glycosyltransferase involved in cell wall biosynthesis
MRKSENPLVSILMTCYNRQLLIVEAIESVLALTYKNFELIVVDDCSTDNSFAVANCFAQKDSRIKVYRNECNLGDYVNRNKAASYAKGKYIKYLDSDDIIFPWALDVMVNCMENFPEAAMGVSLNMGYNIIYPKCYLPSQIYRLYYYRNLLLTVGPTATILKRDVFEQFGGFSKEQFIGDTEFWLRISQRYPLVLVPPGQIYWREHGGQQIMEERKNLAIEGKRSQINESLLNNNACPLAITEAATILRNLKNIKCRYIIQNCIQGRISYALERKRHLGLSWRDFLFALKRNKVPDTSLIDI